MERNEQLLARIRELVHNAEQSEDIGTKRGNLSRADFDELSALSVLAGEFLPISFHKF